jgi:hypothetical protein
LLLVFELIVHGLASQSERYDAMGARVETAILEKPSGSSCLMPQMTAEPTPSTETAVRLDICGAGSLVRALVALNLLLALLVLLQWPQGEGRIGALLLLSWVEPAALLWLALMCMTQRLWRLRGAARCWSWPWRWAPFRRWV